MTKTEKILHSVQKHYSQYRCIKPAIKSSLQPCRIEQLTKLKQELYVFQYKQATDDGQNHLQVWQVPYNHFMMMIRYFLFDKNWPKCLPNVLLVCQQGRKSWKQNAQSYSVRFQYYEWWQASVCAVYHGFTSAALKHVYMMISSLGYCSKLNNPKICLSDM